MPTLFVFLLKVNIALIVFCIGYYAVLRQLTFYTLNRVYLCTAIIFSSIYPLIKLDAFMQRHQQLAAPVQNIIINWKAPAELIQQPDYWHYTVITFWIGASLFAGRLVMQLLSLLKLYRNSKPGVIQGQNVRIVKADISPFSFWQSIYINPDNLNTSDLKSILKHEQIHVKQWHTLDILLAEISVIFYWFNPGIWLIKKTVRENIEFITDRKILQQGIDSKAYQYSLLNVSFSATTSPAVTNHFNFSTLKKRIQMMNAKRSSNMNLTRYAFLVPAVLICLFAVSLSKAELVKKSNNVYKSIAATVSTITEPVVKQSITNNKSMPSLTRIDTSEKPQKIVIVNVKHDTIIIPKTHDSITYIIDGVRGTSADLKKIAPDNIETINVTKTTGNIISVITKGNDHKFVDGQNPSYGVVVIGYGAKINDKTAATVVTDIPLNNVTSDKINAVRINGATFTPDSASKNKIRIASGRSYSNFKTVYLNTNETSINNFSDKLIYIDGKEATEKEMKKLPVSKIENISVNKGKDMTDKYGDKAQNGVLFITTKKGK
jgi:bla regulator protein BlaR1